MKLSRAVLFVSASLPGLLTPIIGFTIPAASKNIRGNNQVGGLSRTFTGQPAAFRSNLSTSFASKYGKDTDEELPSFETKEEYTQYLMDASALPKGFMVGSAIGSFIPEEAPSMGSLPIKGTIIHLTDGPTDSWAATFTQNKVRICK